MHNFNSSKNINIAWKKVPQKIKQVQTWKLYEKTMLESINPLHLNSNAPKGSNLTQALNDRTERSHILSVYWCCASALNMWLVIGHCWLWNWRLTVVICNLAFVYSFDFKHVTSFCNFSIHHKVGEGDWAAMQEETYQTSWDMMLCVTVCDTSGLSSQSGMRGSTLPNLLFLTSLEL